ncbi:MAG TPA: gliding motility-associated C-terminal domain-containing protein [Bacteroidales bacterium]|nr:gliding motility-associated C-terminal domain-containing protein [Bacteroidales bacterium]
MKKRISVSLIFFICFSTLVFSQRGKNSALTVSSTGTVVNAYTTLISDASAANMSITVGSNILNNHFTSNLAAGDLIFIIQMQGATMQGGAYWSNYGYLESYNNSGKYEFAQVASVSGSNIIFLTCGLINDYSAGGHTQIVRVPRYTTLTINSGGELTCDPWNGSTGGVLVVETLGSVTNNGVVNVTGKGFRGGVASTVIANSYTQDVFASTDPTWGGQKGEGIAGQGGVDGTYCKGPPANGGGGGNSHNHGGGGGCNVSGINTYTGKGIPDLSCPLCAAAWELEAVGFSTSVSYGGGRGGYSFSANNQDASMVGPTQWAWGGTGRTNHGGLGGWPLYENEGGYKRLFMGGGGGGGHQNDNWGGAGGNGGGIIYFMSYGSVVGSGSFQAHGNPGGNSDGLVQPDPWTQDVTGTDGCGGGGGGGSIVINTLGGISNISAYADGGKGGDQIKRVSIINYVNQEAEGPGGGGGGGYIAVSGTPSITKTTNGGANGTTSVGPGTALARNSLDEFPPNGATKGGPGINNGVVTNFILSSPNVTACQGQPVTLWADITGSLPGGLSYGWYTAPIGGTLLSPWQDLVINNPQVQDTFYFRTCPGTYSIAVIMFVSPFLPDAGNNVSICTGNTVGLQATCGGCTSSTYNWLPATGLSNSHVSNPTFSGTTTTTYSVTITNQIGCSAVDYVTVNVNPTNTITLTSPSWTNAQTKCINTSISNITYATTVATGATITGLPAGVTGSWASNIVTISGTPSVTGTFTYTITLTGGCGTVSATGTITVWPDGTLTLTAGGTQTTCINTAITTTTYFTTISSGATIAGLPAGVTGSWASDVVTISGTPSVAGTFTYTVTLTGGCGSANTTGTITVTPNNTISLTAGGTQTKCINTAITPTTYATTGATGATITGLPAGLSGSWASNVVTISGTPTVSGTFIYTINLTGGCGTVTANGTITVTPDNTVSVASSTPTLCINTALTAITHTTSGATGVGTATGLPTGVTASWASNTITISGTPTVSGTFTYSIPLTGGCGTVNATGTITVTPNNTITLVAGGTQTKCINTAITTTTYATTGATGALFSGLPAGVTGNWASDTVTISGTPTVTGTFTYTVTSTGGCGGTTTSGTITVISNNIVALSSVAGTDAQTKCINTAILNITYATGGATGAVVSGLPAGVSGNWASNVVTISGTPSVSGAFTYTIALTGGCGTVTANGTITVTPNNTVTAPSSTPTLCINTALTAITHTTSGATGIGTPAGLPAGVSASWTANTITISGTPSISGIFNYSIPLTGGCGTVSATGTITVTPDNTITLVSGGTQTVCINTAVNATTYSTTGATNAVFSGLPAGVTGMWASNVIIISGTPTESGTFTYTVTLTGGCGTVTTNNTITVIPNNIITLSSAVGTDAQTLCVNTPITNINYATVGATGAVITGLPAGITGSWAANAVTISGTPSVTGTFTYTITLTGGCGVVTTNGTITASQDNTIILSSAAGTNAQTRCVNTAITSITYTTTGATGATFIGLPAGVNGNWASNMVTISGTPSVSGAFIYTITLTGGCGTITTSGTITVTPDNTITLSSAAGTNAQTQCINTAITNITYTTTGATGATFNGLPAGVTGSWASNTVTISGTPTVSGTFNYTITLTGGCGTITNAGSIIVTPADNPAFHYLLSTYCQSGTDPAAIITGGATGTFSATPAGLNFLNTSSGLIDLSASAVNNYVVTFTTNGTCPSDTTFAISIVTAPSAAFSYAGPYCQDDTDPTPILGMGAIAGIFSAAPAGLVFVNTSTGEVNLAASTAGTYTVTNNIAATGGCPASSATANITVNPLPLVTIPGNMSVCNNDNVPATNFATIPAGGTFTWTNSNTAIGLAAGGTGNIAAFNATNPGTNPITATITVTPTANNCTGHDTTYTITVNPTPTVVVPGNITVCNGATVTATTFSSPTTGAAYSWTNSDSNIGIGASGTGNITAFTATNTSSVPITATISVTPTAYSCTGTVSAYSITVNPSPLVVIPSDTSVCHGTTIAGTAFNSPTSGATFTWTNSSTSIGVGASGTGDITSFTATNTGAVPVVATITVTATANSCAGTPSSYTITVNPLPGIVMNNTLPTCPGLNNGTITPEITSGTAPYQYSWSTGAVTPQLTDLGNGTYVVTVTDFKGCAGTNSIEFSVYDDCLDPVVYVPNIFSPNDDGQNDIFYVRGQDIKYMDLLIYDRWGEKIFESEDIAVGWDGTYKGKEMPSGVYVYKLTVTMNDGSEIKKKGNISLVR